jgi:hypothetical protein
MKLFEKHLMVLLVLFIGINFTGCGENITKIRTKNDETAVTDNDVNDDLLVPDEVSTESDEDSDIRLRSAEMKWLIKVKFVTAMLPIVLTLTALSLLAERQSVLMIVQGLTPLHAVKKKIMATQVTQATLATPEIQETPATQETQGIQGIQRNSGDSGNTGNTGEIITPICDSSIDSGTKDPAESCKGNGVVSCFN